MLFLVETAALIFRAMDVYGDASTGSRSNDDEIDLKVLDLKFNDGGGLEIKLTNLGDEDVDRDERVYIAIFVDGDEEHEFYRTNSSSSSFSLMEVRANTYCRCRRARFG